MATDLERLSGNVDPVVAAVSALPLPLDDSDQRWNLRSATAAWLRSRKSDHTRRGYFRELSDYLGWCDATGLDPREAKRGDIDAYVATRCEHLAASSRGRRLSTLSSWYRYLMSNDVTGKNPLDAVDRPSVSRDASPTVGLTGPQSAAFMRAARAATTRNAKRDTALLGMLAELGLRVDEALRLDLTDFRHNRGHRTVRVTGKGGKHRELPIPAPLGRDLDAYLDQRGSEPGPFFVTATGTRMDQPSTFRLVRRIATAAGLPNPERLSPHSLRHSVATSALDAGAPLRDVQDLLGHADPRTTRRYDRSRGSLDRSPAYLIAGIFADEETDSDVGEQSA